MPTIPPKFVEKEKITIKDPVVIEIDAEVDRLTLCEKIVQKSHQNPMNLTFNDSTSPEVIVPASTFNKISTKTDEADQKRNRGIKDKRT